MLTQIVFIVLKIQKIKFWHWLILCNVKGRNINFRDEIRPFNLCTAVAKKLGCKKRMDDVCYAEVRYMPL